jgi:hypothetical protein
MNRYGRLIWTGKGPAISSQVLAMARREQLNERNTPATEAQACNSNQKLVTPPHCIASPAHSLMLQDIDDSRDDCSRGLSGRLA